MTPSRALSVLLALCATATCLTTSAFELPTHARNGRLWAMIQTESQAMFTVPTPELWFTQRHDHFASDDSKTFQQRFYESNTYWRSPDGPVILYIGGEGALTKTPGGYVDVLAKKWGAKVLALEHRFYGKSVPNNDLSTPNYKYLKVEQALADLKYFKEQYEETLPAPHTHKWIAVGGSYPGALSAWFRIAYPNTTVASLASSGVVDPVYEFYQFDEQVALSAGEQCANALRETTKAFEDEIKKGNATAVKGLLGAQDLCDADFFYMVADAAAMAVQYGHKDVVCNHMTQALEQKLSLTEEFANFTIEMYGKDFGSGCFYDTTCLINNPSKWADVRSWRWQKCSQLAYFQVAPKTGSIRSSIVDLDYHEKQCQAVFGDVVNPKEGVKEIIKRYGGIHPKGHKIFYSNGGDDPWQRASVLKTISDDQVANLAVCDLCGHCGDLRADPDSPEPLKKQRAEIMEYLTKWLEEEDVIEEAVQDAVKGPLKQVYRSSPFMLLPVLVAVGVLAVIVHKDLIRDSPTNRRAGYVRLEIA
ncbi:hypothetical protein Poli38472_011579 [Pythium oligandrum]|uniref:Serine protease n=1 Tax=Pythium oligandrum TaxID=41045 RepID=A0A8K1CKF1_PYTOL|nr:hypothetical protein Poli38472_011579 [Pythium oligandrum]|eukprot:TMW64699.1 hypothetical protein Poli38472_011579 [Pythium oligandrum]